MAKLVVYFFFFVTFVVGDVLSESGEYPECHMCLQLCSADQSSYVLKIEDDDSSGSSGSGVDSSCDLCLELCSGVGDFYMTNTEANSGPQIRLNNSTYKDTTSQSNNMNKFMIIGIICAVGGMVVGIAISVVIGAFLYKRHKRTACAAGNLHVSNYGLQNGDSWYQSLQQSPPDVKVNGNQDNLFFSTSTVL